MSTVWRTPKRLFEALDLQFVYQVDAAASGLDHLLPIWYGPGSKIATNALEVAQWHSPAWCNPPYGKDLQPFLDKFIEQAKLGVKITALLPAYTGEHWFNDKVRPYADLLFLRGRVPFDNPCEHCAGTGTCSEPPLEGEVLSGKIVARYCCEGNICEVCGGTGISPAPSQPRFGSVLAFYGPEYRGRVDWWDWRQVLG